MQPAIDDEYVVSAAAAVDLELSRERAIAVTAHLRRIAVIASPLFDVTLDFEDEMAPVWRP
jgi:Protein of unknown function (DUF4089)